MDYGREDGGEGEIQVAQVAPPELGYKKPPPQTKGFAAATAEVTGESKAQINRNVSRAEAIGPDILKLSGTSLDKGVELDALAKLPGQIVTVTKWRVRVYPRFCGWLTVSDKLHYRK